MQFIDVNKARGIKFSEPIFGLAADGQYHQIRLVSKQETSTGTEYKWDFAYFEGNGTGTGSPIVAVAIPKVKSSMTIDHSNNDNLAFNG